MSLDIIAYIVNADRNALRTIAVNGSLISEKEQKRLHLSHAEQNASMHLQALLYLMRRVESTQV